MNNNSPHLNQPLPAAIAVGSPRWWLAYRAYPVFSLPWVWRRALFFGLFVAAWGALSGVLFFAEGGDGREALALSAYFVAGVGIIINAGPILAAVVRHWRLPARRERWLVVSAILVGFGLAGLADLWSSSAMMELTGSAIERELTGQALLINLLVLLAIYALVGGGLALRAYLSEHRRLADFQAEQAMTRLEADKLAADQQLAMLQAQIEPHFLFNSLATIRSDIRDQPEQAERTLDALCDYLRATIPRLRSDGNGTSASLGEQLEICRQYLSVMQRRMQDRLAFSISAESSLEKLPFPPFILLSLVENAIRHGLEPKASGGRIDIAARQSGERLIVTVTDTGVGLSGASGSGVGLSNIRQQLKLRHGDRARLHLEGDADGGTRASIELPAEPGQ